MEAWTYALPFLDDRALGAALSTCRTWRTTLLGLDWLWEELTRRLCPNLRVLPSSATPAGRQGYLERRWLLAGDSGVAGPPRFPGPPGIPSSPPTPKPSPQRVPWTPFAEKAATWPRSITFLIDLHFRGTRILSTSRSCALDCDGRVAGWDVAAAEDLHDPVEGRPAVDCTLREDLQVEIVEPEAIAAVHRVVDETTDPDSLWSKARTSFSIGTPKDDLPLHLLLSFWVAGLPNRAGDEQGAAPTILLNERRPFFSGMDDLLFVGDKLNGHFDFRSDVTECWGDRWRELRMASEPSPKLSMTNGVLHATTDSFNWRNPDAQQTPFGKLPGAQQQLPFDPAIELRLSACGQDKRFRPAWREPNQRLPYMSSDHPNACTVQLELNFRIGEYPNARPPDRVACSLLSRSLDFANVLTALLVLRGDPRGDMQFLDRGQTTITQYFSPRSGERGAAAGAAGGGEGKEGGGLSEGKSREV